MLKRACYVFLQCTWGIVQTFAGFLCILRFRECRHEWYHGAYVTYLDGKTGGISLGMFVFVGDAQLVPHEYGHTIQSLILGPLYLIVIGVPSFTWANLPYFVKMRREKNISYYSMWCEKWANRLGNYQPR